MVGSYFTSVCRYLGLGGSDYKWELEYVGACKWYIKSCKNGDCVYWYDDPKQNEEYVTVRSDKKTKWLIKHVRLGKRSIFAPDTATNRTLSFVVYVIHQ